MENIWPFLRLYLGLLLLNACEGYPIDSSRTSGGAAEWTYLNPVLAVAFLMAAVLLVTGCVCCRQNKGFQEFTDSASSHSLSGAGGGYVNSAANTTEFTIFPPAQNTVVASHNQPGDRSSVVRFEPLPDIKPPQVHTRRPAAFNNVVNHGLSAEDWFQDPHINFPRQQLKYVRELGCGWFGRVVEGEAQNIVPGEKSTRVVVKILHEDATTTDQMYFLHEVKPYRDLSHPNVLRLLGRCLETDPFLVLLESCPSGDLKSFLSQNIATAEALNKQGITLRMACNISEGLQHLHNNNFVHTDLAARNCLVTPDLTVKVGDYGTSIDIFKEDYYCAGDVALPIRWCAPETLHCTETTIETKEVTQAANVWSLGVVLWEICEFGKLPYTELSDDEVIVKVLGEASYRLPPPSVPSQHGQNMYLLMKQCWSPKNVRPALAQVFAMLNHLYSSWERYGQDGDNTSLKTDEDFERRWEMFKPNTIPKTDNHVPSKDSTPIVLSPAHLATEKPQLHLCTDTLSVDRNSSTPLTTSPQPSLASSSGGDFYLPTLHQRHKSPSLQNLHGSIEDLSDRVEQVSWQRVDEQDETSSQPSSDEREKIVEEKSTLLEPDFDSWLRGVETTNEEDAKFVRKISEAIRDLDNALALEKTSSSSSEASSHCTSQQQSPAKDIANVMTEENVVLDFRLGRADSGVSSDDREMTFQPDSLQEDSYLECAKNRGTDSGTDTEDETWRRRIERGEFSEKVKEKSKSVADLMILTHIECSDGSDSEPPSLTWSIDRSSNGRGSFRLRHGSVNKNTPMLAYSSENDIHGVVLGDDFRNTLKRLQAEVQRTVAKHILPASDTEEQALLPSNHNRDENFLVIDASEETQKKNEIGNVSKVPEEDSGCGITLVDNVPQTNVIEYCTFSLEGKGNTNDGSQCYHSFHTDNEEQNICSKEVNELQQNTSSIIQPISCQKMENKMLPLQFGITQTSGVDVPPGVENITSSLQLEMPHVLDRETTSQGSLVLDFTSGTEKQTSPSGTEIIPHVSDIETTPQVLSVVDVTSCAENRTSPLRSEVVVSNIQTTSQGLPVTDDASYTENRTSPKRSEVAHVSDIKTTSQGLPDTDVTSDTENRTSPISPEISNASDIHAASPIRPEVSNLSDIDATPQGLAVVHVTSSAKNRTSQGQPVVGVTSSSTENNTSQYLPVVDVTSSSTENNTAQDLPVVDVTSSSSENNTSQDLPVVRVTSSSSENRTSQDLPVVDVTSSIENRTPQGLPVVDVISSIENRTPQDLPVVDVTSSIENRTPQGLPVVDVISSIENRTPQDLPVVDVTSSTENRTSQDLPVVDVTSSIENRTPQGLPVVDVISSIENRTPQDLPVVDVTSSTESRTSQDLPVVDVTSSIENRIPQDLPVVDVTSSTENRTPQGLAVVDVTSSSSENNTSQDLPVVDVTSSIENRTPQGLPIVDVTSSTESRTSQDLPVVDVTSSTENRTPPGLPVVDVTSSTENITPQDLPVVDVTSSTENITSSLSPEVSNVSDINATPQGLPVVDVTSSAENRTSSLSPEVSNVSDIDATPQGLPVADVTSSADNRTPQGLPVVDVISSAENRTSSLSPEVSNVSDIDATPQGLPVVDVTSSTENITPQELPVVDVTSSTENRTPQGLPVVDVTSSTESRTPQGLPVVDVTSSTENRTPQGLPVVDVTSSTESRTSEDLPVVDVTLSIENRTPQGLPVVDVISSAENRTSSLSPEVPNVSDIDATPQDLPVANVTSSAENRTSSLRPEVSNVSDIDATPQGLPVADVISSAENKISQGLPVVFVRSDAESRTCPLSPDICHVSNIETTAESLPFVDVTSGTENKIHPLKTAMTPASNIELTSQDLPAVVNVAHSSEDETSALRSEITPALEVVKTHKDAAENKNALNSEMYTTSNIETTSKRLPVAVDFTSGLESQISPQQSEMSSTSNLETAFKTTPVDLISHIQNKMSPQQLEMSPVSVTETSKNLPVDITSNIEKKPSLIMSSMPHPASIETTSKILLVDTNVTYSTENKTPSSPSDVEKTTKVLPNAACVTESKTAISGTETMPKGLVAANDKETAYRGPPLGVDIIQSTDNEISALKPEMPHVSGLETVSKDLPVLVDFSSGMDIETSLLQLETTSSVDVDSEIQNKLQSEAYINSNSEKSKSLPLHASVVQNTENKTSALQSRTSDIETPSEDPNVSLHIKSSTDSQMSPLESEISDALDIKPTPKGLPVAVTTNAENEETALESPISLSSQAQTAAKTSNMAENNISSLLSEVSPVSDIDTVFTATVSTAENKDLPVSVDATSDIENKTSALTPEAPHASDTKTPEDLPFANSRSPDVTEDVPSVILGACEDYTLDYFQGLKSTLEESQQPKNLASFENASNYEQHLVDYSIDSWEKHLSSALHDHEERTDLFDITFREGANFFEDEDDSVVELYIDQPQGSSKITASDKGEWNTIGRNQASNFLTVGLPAALTSRDVSYIEEKLKNSGLCIPSLNVIAATPVPSGRSSPETTENVMRDEAEESGGENALNKTDENSQKECDPCFNFPVILNDGQQIEEDDKQYVADIVGSEHRSCDKHYTSDVENALENNKANGHGIFVQDPTETKTSEDENKKERVQNVDKHCTYKPEDGVQVIKESKALDKHHASHKQAAKQTETSEQLSTMGNHGSQEDLLIAEDSVFGRPKSFVQDLFSPELMKHPEQLEFSVALSHMEGRQSSQVFGEKEANQVSAALNSWKQSGQQNRMLMEDFLLGERLASGPFEEEEMAKQSTPDDERSSDSGFRDKGSLSESCDDACDEKYHLEDIEAELEESNKSRCDRDKNVSAQDEWLDKLPAAGGKMFQDENPSVSTNSQAALSLSVDSDKDAYSDSVFTSEVEGGFGEKEADTYFSSGTASEEQDVGNITEQDDTSKSGWYLHPPVKPQELNEDSGWTASPRTSDNNGNDNSYVSFNLEEEFVTAIRNELREKLPCSALHQQQEMEEEEEEEELNEDEEERRDIVIHYNTYPAPLSPILEERESVSSITTTLSDHVSPFAHSRDVLKSGSDSEPLSPVFMLDPKEEAEEMDAKRFEQEIREALENCSMSSEEVSSLSDENAKKSSVLFEDLEHQSSEEVIVVQNANNNNSEDDDLLVVDTETNQATLLESPKPKSHLAFVRKAAVEESITTPSDDEEELTVGINTDTYVISKSRFSDDSMLEKQKNTSSDEEVYTPDSISPENAVTASSLFSPDTENMSDFFLTPSEKSPSNTGDLLLHNLNNNADTDTVQELVANNEAAEIISELQNASICNNNSILLFNANNNDNIVPEVPFKRNITAEDNWMGCKASENDNSVVISVEEVNESSNKIDRLGYLRSPNLEVPREESEERDWSLPNLDATLLSTKAPMPSPEEESWKQIPSMLAFTDLNEVMARCGTNAEEEEEDEDPYPYQVDDNDLMSTSFSVNPDEQECYTPDWESGDSEDDNNSSSSGEFIWKEGDREASVKAVDISVAAATAVSVAAKYDGLSEFPMEVIAEEDEDEEEEDDADGSSSCGSGTEFVPSAWNSEATPNRSALRSPDKRSDHKKNVSFKKQKYHCVYEYPRETSDSDSEGFDSPTRRPHWNNMSYQQPVVDYASFADWELMDADALPADSQDTDTDPDDNPTQQQLDFYKLSNVDYDFGCGGMVSEDGEFFISSSARPFQFSGVGSNSAEVGGSQFFPGATEQIEDVSLDFITPDSGITDMNVQSGSTVEPHEEDAEVSEVTEWEPGEDAAAVGCDEVPASPSSPMSPSGLGELRHTRDRLKLDLPTKNTAFVLDPPALGKRRAVETVKGEASLLDSGEETEDSGIESSNGALTSSKPLSLAENMKDTKV